MGQDLLSIPDSQLSDKQLRAKYAPVHYGPTWERNEDGSWKLPKHTLGWHCAYWAAEYLSSLDNGAAPGTPFRFTLEQLRLLLWWYAVDSKGNFIYQNGVIQRVKGWGKDPMSAVIALIECFGPSRFGGWDENGDPIGVPCPNPWVNIAAVSQEQTNNTMSMFPLLVTERLKREYKVDVKKENIYGLQGKARIQAVTSSPHALQGKRTTLAILNETQHWYASNGGKLMLETIDGNIAKVSGRYIAITNAPDPSEQSVAQEARENYMAMLEGRKLDPGILYDSLEVPTYTPMDERVFKIAFDMVRGDSSWLDPEAMWKSAANPSRSVAQTRRMYYNQTWTPDAALYDPSDWDQLYTDSALEDGDEIVLGFDGGKNDDSTGLVAMRVSDCFLEVLGLWEKPDGPEGEGWSVPREAVDARVHDVFARFNVVGFFADIALWQSHILDWDRTFGSQLKVAASDRSPIGWDMAAFKNVTFAHEAFVTAIKDRRVRHGGNKALRRHVLNVYRRDTRWGVSFQKESRESKRKIDLYAAALAAFTCWRRLQQPKDRRRSRRESGRVWFGR